MKLFWTPASPFVRKVLVAAIELDVRDRIEIVPTFWPHEWATHTVAFEPSFIAANPIGRIPTLVTDAGVALPESNWICAYLDSLGPQRRLLPQRERHWEDVRLLAIADGAIEAMILRRAETLRKGPEKSPAFIGKQRDRIARCLDVLERDIAEVVGVPSLPQIATGVACSFMDFRYGEDEWRAGRPRLNAWYEAFAERHSMQETKPAETPQREPA